MRKKLYAVLCLVLVYTGLSAQTFHVLGFFDVESNIGSGVNEDMKAIQKEISLISQNMAFLGYQSKVSLNVRENYSKTALMSALDSLKIGSDDVVLFIYNGHGSRAINDDDRFPQLCLNERSSANFVPATLVKNILVSKGARLSLVLTFCCNSESEGVSKKPLTVSKAASTDSDRMREICKQLFVLPKGYVMMTSSKAGEYSWVYHNEGTVGWKHFSSALNEIKEGSLKADWQVLSARYQQTCSMEPIPYNGIVFFQHPDYIVDLSVDQKMPNVAAAEQRDEYQAINRAINQILDRSILPKNKKQLMSDIESRYFPRGGTIITMLEDRNTIIRYEEVSEFLNRLAKSKDIRKVTVFNFERNKYFVYEYR